MVFLNKVFLILITSYSLLTGYRYTDNTEIVYKRIPLVNSPEQVLWLNEEKVILVDDEDVFLFNFKFQSLQKVGEREPNELVGISNDGSIRYCNFEHRVINSFDEFSTTFTILDGERNLVKGIDLFPTIRPLLFLGDTIIAVTAVDFLEEHFYRISVDDTSIEEIDRPSMKEITLYPPFEITGLYWFRDVVLYEGVNGFLFYPMEKRL